ncbi:hypothetical protein [Shewanella algicola]|uniref:hypothetical protein n=1 Tax=Shewanella algicola TaxID=640633 RepID=UPI0024942575|nr:hypothetical protein [Shewanella algicola]
MTTIDQAYINALLADATYALDDSVERGTTGNELEEFLNERMTPTQAEYIGPSEALAFSNKAEAGYKRGQKMD